MPGEFRDVDVPGGAIKDNITFMPYKEPSNVLYQLLGDIVNEGRRFASAADVKAADINGEAPVGTTLAVLEREMKVMSAVQARVHHSMGQEIRILSDIVRDFGPETYPYELEGEEVTSEDFDDRVDVIPVSDPNAGTMAQRIMQYQAALQLAAQAPQMYDMPLLHRQMIEILGIRDADEIIPTDKDAKPIDPVSENMDILNGKPVKAFIYQDHEAHIQTHLSAAQNPKIMELMSRAPQAKMIEAAMAAHIQEHVAFAYRAGIEKELGVELPPPNEPLPEDIELRISRLAAPASAQLTGKAQQEAQMKQQMEQMQDPVIQMQQKELQLKEAELQGKAQLEMAKVQMAMGKAVDQKELELQRLDQNERIETARIAAKIAADNLKAETEEQRIMTEKEADAFKQGVDLVKDITLQEQRLND